MLPATTRQMMRRAGMPLWQRVLLGLVYTLAMVALFFWTAAVLLAHALRRAVATIAGLGR